MSNIPIKEVVPRISQQLTLLVYELPDAHDDTARLAAGLASDVRWKARVGRQTVALASTGHSS